MEKISQSTSVTKLDGKDSTDMENVLLETDKRRIGEKAKQDTCSDTELVRVRPAIVFSVRRKSTESVKKTQENDQNRIGIGKKAKQDTCSDTEERIQQRVNHLLQSLKIDIKHNEEFYKNEKRKPRLTSSFHSFFEDDESVEHVTRTLKTNSQQVDIEHCYNETVSENVFSKSETDTKIILNQCYVPVLYPLNEVKPGEQISLNTKSLEISVVKGPDPNSGFKIISRIDHQKQSSEEIETGQVKDNDVLLSSKSLPLPAAFSSYGILKKRKDNEDAVDTTIGSCKRRRVNVSDPPVSCCKFIEKNTRHKYSASLKFDSIPQEFVADVPSTSRSTSESVLKWIPSKAKHSILNEEILGKTIKTVIRSIMDILNEKKLEAQPLVKLLLSDHNKISNILIKDVIKFIAKKFNQNPIEILKHLDSKSVCQSLLELASKSESSELIQLNLSEMFTSIINNPNNFVSFLSKLNTVELSGVVIRRMETRDDMSEFLKQIYDSVPYELPVPKELLHKEESKEESDGQIVENIIEKMENGNLSEELITSVLNTAMKHMNCEKICSLLFNEIKRRTSP